MLERALARQIGSVALQVRTTQGGGVELLKQLDPDIDLTSSRVEVDPMVGEYATGSWGDEVREFHLSVRVPAAAWARPCARAQVSLLVDGEKAGQVPVMAVWTDDFPRSTVINQRWRMRLARPEIASAADQGFDAWRRGDMAGAATHLGRAVQLADAAGNHEMLDKLSKVVDWDDPGTGLVRPRDKFDRSEMLDAEAASAKTYRTLKPPRSETDVDEQVRDRADLAQSGSDSPPERPVGGDDPDRPREPRLSGGAPV